MGARSASRVAFGKAAAAPSVRTRGLEILARPPRAVVALLCSRAIPSEMAPFLRGCKLAFLFFWVPRQPRMAETVSLRVTSAGTQHAESLKGRSATSATSSGWIMFSEMTESEKGPFVTRGVFT